MASSFMRVLDLIQWRTTFPKTPLDKWALRSRELYLTTHNTHKRQTYTYMPPVGFELTISSGERPQTYALTAWTLGPALRDYCVCNLCVCLCMSFYVCHLFRHWWLTDFRKESPYCVATSRSAGQKFTAILWNLTVHDSIHKTPISPPQILSWARRTGLHLRTP
jgi:hypothetical protein